MDINALTPEEKKALIAELSKDAGPAETPAPVSYLRHVKCSCGFEWDVNPKNLDDMELYDDLMALDDKRPNVKPVLQRVLGEDGQQALYETCREDGRVRASLVNEALLEIFAQLNAKN